MQANTKTILGRVLTVVLACGTIFAFYTIYKDFSIFYGFEGTLFKVTDCVVPNPVTTPCFYGAFGFLIAFIWSIKLMKFEPAKQFKHRKWMVWFLIAGNIFAWSNYLYSIRGFFKEHDGPIIGCSGQIVTNPFGTACFIGASIFLVSLILGITVYCAHKKLQESTTKPSK